jgi:hypothetical protein
VGTFLSKFAHIIHTKRLRVRGPAPFTSRTCETTMSGVVHLAFGLEAVE